MRYKPLPSSVFVENRKHFRESLKHQSSLAVFVSNDIMPTNADGEMGFVQNSDLYYLSGIDQPETILVIFPEAYNPQNREILFIKETSPEIMVWQGPKLSKQEAAQLSGIENVQWLGNFDTLIKTLAFEAENIYLNLNEHLRASNGVRTQEHEFIYKMREMFPLHRFHRSAPLMHYLRATKATAEVKALQTAIDITHQGFVRALKFISPGIYEYEIEAEFIHEFIKNGSRGFSYAPIIASGSSACILHYNDNDKVCHPGDLVLMDVGAEYANYRADLTRTVPVSGTFTPRQRAVYNAVLNVMRQAIAKLRPGNRHKEYTDEVNALMQEELIKLDLITADEVKNQDPNKPAFKRYFMHGVSHFLGIDTHDVGSFNRPFEKGMVFTCEPGIYIPEEGLGIRLENNILITETGPVDLMANIPIDPDHIEEIMAETKTKSLT